MDKLEAKIVLQALRPGDVETAQPAFAEALAMVKRDPALKAWWEAQQAFDRAVAAKLKDIPIPEDLRASILAGRKIEQFRPRHTQFSFWLAAAAAVAIFCALGTSQFIKNFGPLPRGEYTAAILPLLHNDSPTLAMTTPDHDKIIAWLKDHQAPMGTLPVKLADMPSLGCQKYMIHGHAVTLICFSISGGAEAHLFIVPEDAITDPPSSTGPEMWQVDGWSTASWSDGKMSYVLATQAGPEALKQLL
jgi:anti-sigma factor RsiW